MGKHILAVADNGVIVFQLVIGVVGIIHERQVVKTVESRKGAVPHLFPVLLERQELDIGGHLDAAFGIGVGRQAKPFSRLFFPARGIIICPCGRKDHTVPRMRICGQRNQGIEAFPVQLQDLGIHAARKIADIHALAGGRHIFRAEEGGQGAEIVRIAALVAVHFGQSHQGRHIVTLQRKRLLIACLRKGIGIIVQIIVAGEGKHPGR